MIARVSLPANSRVAIQRCGYAAWRDPRSGDESYVRRLGTGFYPRFHLYTEDQGGTLVLKLHLDQKKPSYGVGHAHSGEYDGSTVETELGRILRLLGSTA